MANNKIEITGLRKRWLVSSLSPIFVVALLIAGTFCVDGEMLCKQYVRDGLGMVYLFSLNRARADADVFLPRDSGRSMVCFGRVLLASRPRVPRA